MLDEVFVSLLARASADKGQQQLHIICARTLASRLKIAQCIFLGLPLMKDRTPIMHLIIPVLVALLVGGCASNVGGYTSALSVEKRLIGLSETQVIQMLGAPENEVMLTGRKAWTHSDRIESITGGDCRISLTIKEEKVETAIVNASDYSFVSYPLGSCRNILRRLN